METINSYFAELEQMIESSSLAQLKRHVVDWYARSKKDDFSLHLHIFK